MSTIRFLRTFLAAAQGGSFTAAADKVALTQAAVGLQMRALEGELKQKLFDKNGRAMSLSMAGRALVPRAEQLLADYDALRRDVRNPQQRIAGTVSVGAITTAMTLLSSVLVELKGLHPDLDVRLNTCDADQLAMLVRQGELDAAVILESSLKDAGDQHWTRLYDEPFVFIASASVASARSDVAELLQSQPFLRFDRRSPTGVRIDQILRRRHLKTRDFIELNSLGSIVDLVRQRVGVTIVPLLKTFGWEHDPTLCVIRLSGQPVTRQIGLLERAEASLNTRIVREQLVARLSHNSTPRRMN